jgi:hypothetical protein
MIFLQWFDTEEMDYWKKYPVYTIISLLSASLEHVTTNVRFLNGISCQTYMFEQINSRRHGLDQHAVPTRGRSSNSFSYIKITWLKIYKCLLKRKQAEKVARFICYACSSLSNLWLLSQFDRKKSVEEVFFTIRYKLKIVHGKPNVQVETQKFPELLKRKFT